MLQCNQTCSADITWLTLVVFLLLIYKCILQGVKAVSIDPYMKFKEFKLS